MMGARARWLAGLLLPSVSCVGFARADSFVHDTSGRLVAAARAGVVDTYKYDATGALVSVCTRSAGRHSCRKILYDDRAGQVMAETSSSQAVRYAHGPTGLSLIDANGRVARVLGDEAGSVRGLASASGALTLRRAYEPFGKLRVEAGDPAGSLGWNGEHTSPAGPVWLRARHYLPHVGRFLQRDTMAGWPTDLRSLNRYAFAHANPNSYVDPSGNVILPVAVLAAVMLGGIIGTALAPFADLGGSMAGQWYYNPTGCSGGPCWDDALDDSSSRYLGYVALNQALLDGADLSGLRARRPSIRGRAPRMERVSMEETAKWFGMDGPTYNAHVAAARAANVKIVTTGGAPFSVHAIKMLGLPAKPGTWVGLPKDEDPLAGMSPLRKGHNDLSTNPRVPPWPATLPDGFGGQVVSDGDFVSFSRGKTLLGASDERAIGEWINEASGVRWIVHGGLARGFKAPVKKLWSEYDKYMSSPVLVFEPDGRVTVSKFHTEVRKLDGFGPRRYRRPKRHER